MHTSRFALIGAPKKGNYMVIQIIIIQYINKNNGTNLTSKKKRKDKFRKGYNSN